MKARITLGFAIVALSAGACGLAVSDEERLQRADDQVAAGNYRTASIEYKNVLVSDPENARARIGLARVLLGLGEVLDAEKEVRRAADLGTPEEEVRPLFLEILLEQGRFMEVLAALGQDENGLTEAQAAKLKGSALSGLQNFNAAESTYRQWLSSAPNDAEAVIGLSRVLALTGRRDEAITQLDSLLAIAPDNADAWSTMGRIRLALGEYETASEAFSRALGNMSLEVEFRNYVSTIVSLADAQMRAQNIDGARQTVGRIVAIAPSAVPTKFLQARIAQIDEDYASAARFLQEILAPNPNDLRALMSLADVQTRQGNLGQATEILNRVITISPDNIQARKMLARIQLEQSDPGAIVEALAPYLDSGDADIYSLIGQANLREGDVEAAIANFRNAAVANPGGISEQVNLSISYLSAGDTELAVQQLLAMPPGQEGDYRREQLLILAYTRSGQDDDADAVVDALWNERGSDPAAMNVVGNYQFSRGAFADARQAFERTLTLDPANITALLGLARVELANENPAAARGRFERVRELESGHPDATLGLARLMYNEGDTESTLQLLQEFQESHASDVRAPLTLAQLYLQQGRQDDALAAARAAAEIGSRFAGVNAAIGKVFLEAGASDEAVVSYELASEQAPNSARVHMELGFAYLSVDRSVDAQVELMHAVELDSELVPAVAALVLVELRQGRENSALERVTEMRQKKPDNVALMLLEGEVYTALEDYVNAADAFRRAARNGGGQRAVLREYQSMRSGGMGGAEAPLTRWLDDHPDDIRVRRFLGDHYMVTGKPSLAMREYEKFLVLEPDNGQVLNNMAWQLQQEGNLQQAVEYAEKARELEPDSGSIADTLGWIYRDLGDAERSEELLRIAAELSPDNGEITYHLAVVLSEMGRREEAREILESLLSRDLQYPSINAAAVLLSDLSPGN